MSDIEDRLGRAVTDEDERLRIEKLLDDASAAIRQYTGRQWETGAVTRSFRPRSEYVTIPHLGSVTTVVDPVTGVDLPYQWDGKDRLYLWPSTFRDGFERDFVGVPGVVTVTYQAVDPVPATVVAVCCQMAARAFGVAPEDSGRQQESIAGYSYSVGIAAASGAVGMLQGERELLDQFRATVGSIWVGGT